MFAGEHLMRMIKVAANSRTSSVAGAIAHSIRENGYTQVQGIGASAVNQMVKATILAGNYLAEEGTTINFVPGFTEVQINGEERTAVRLTITSNSFVEQTAVDHTAIPVF